MAADKSVNPPLSSLLAKDSASNMPVAHPSLGVQLRNAFSFRANIKSLFIRPNGHHGVVDGVRVISSFWVVIYHSFCMYALFHPDYDFRSLVDELPPIWNWVWNASKAVDLFFVISGFLISGILLKQIDSQGSINKGNFYVRRFMRLAPVYYVVLLVYLAIGLRNSENIWANFLYLNNYLFDYGDQAMDWSWSLAVEEQFYIIYPIVLSVIVLHSKRPLTWLWALFVASFAIRYAIVMSDTLLLTTPASAVIDNKELHFHKSTVIYDNFHSRFGSPLIGCIAAYYYFHHKEATGAFFRTVLGQLTAWLALATVVFFAFFPIVSNRFDDYMGFQLFYEVSNHNLFCLGASIVLLASFYPGYLAKLVQFLFAGRFLYPLSQLSYTVYLVQSMVIMVTVPTAITIVTRNPEQFPWSTIQTLMFACSLSLFFSCFLAVFAYLLIERPIMNLRR